MREIAENGTIHAKSLKQPIWRQSRTTCAMRKATIERNTKETRIKLDLDLDGSGEGVVDTGIGFFDHMLELLKKHALVNLTVKAEGDLKVDYHHTVEDVGLVFGKALDQALA